MTLRLVTMGERLRKSATQHVDYIKTISLNKINGAEVNVRLSG